MSGWAVVPGTEPLWVVLAAALAGLLIDVPLRALASGPHQRGSIARVMLSLAAVLAGAALAASTWDLPDAVYALRLAALVALIAGLVGVAGFVLCDLLLARAGVRLPPILRDLLEIVTSVVITFGLLHAWGFNILGLVTTSAVLTAVIGLALQTTLANLIGGLAIQLDQSVSHGDWVRVGGDTGRVIEIGWRATRMVTNDGMTIVVPNGQLVAGQLVNLSRPTPVIRRTVQVGFHYRHPPHEVRDVLVRTVRDVPGVLPQPPPDCIPVEFGESAVVYGLRFWIADFERAIPIEGEVRARVWYAARRAGFEVPFPIRTIVNAEAARDVAPEEADARATLVARIPLFSTLDESEREQVSAAMRPLDFANGETIITQGEEGDSLYVVERGQVGVYLSVGGATREMATLKPGEVFGEMSLLTGEARNATGVAQGNVRCQVIDRDVFQRLIALNPHIAEAFSAHLARRKVELEASREGLTAAARARLTREEQTRLLPRIREFLRVG
jgi:small-conductance mechanosensitive channel/CRP-like cAMP-binding protein